MLSNPVISVLTPCRNFNPLYFFLFVATRKNSHIWAVGDFLLHRLSSRTLKKSIRRKSSVTNVSATERWEWLLRFLSFFFVKNNKQFGRKIHFFQGSSRGFDLYNRRFYWSDLRIAIALMNYCGAISDSLGGEWIN